MAGRGYDYKAVILARQGSLGEAEYCVNLAGQNIAAFETGLDTSLIFLGEQEFIKRTPHRSLKLVNGARSNLERGIDVSTTTTTTTTLYFTFPLHGL